MHDGTELRGENREVQFLVAIDVGYPESSAKIDRPAHQRRTALDPASDAKRILHALHYTGGIETLAAGVDVNALERELRRVRDNRLDCLAQVFFVDSELPRLSAHFYPKRAIEQSRVHADHDVCPGAELPCDSDAFQQLANRFDADIPERLPDGFGEFLGCLRRPREAQVRGIEPGKTRLLQLASRGNIEPACDIPYGAQQGKIRVGLDRVEDLDRLREGLPDRPDPRVDLVGVVEEKRRPVRPCERLERSGVHSIPGIPIRRGSLHDFTQAVLS